MNVHKFIAPHHLTSAWRALYEGPGTSFDLPSEWEVEEVLLEAKKSVARGRNLMVPKALPPPRGRPVMDCGKRRTSFYEKGAGQKKRIYTCGLCRLVGHRAGQCQLRQLFGDDEIAHHENEEEDA